MAACIVIINDIYVSMFFAFVDSVPMVCPRITVDADAMLASGAQAVFLAARFAHTAIGADRAAFGADAVAVIANGGTDFTHTAIFA